MYVYTGGTNSVYSNHQKPCGLSGCWYSAMWVNETYLLTYLLVEVWQVQVSNVVCHITTHSMKGWKLNDDCDCPSIHARWDLYSFFAALFELHMIGSDGKNYIDGDFITVMQWMLERSAGEERMNEWMNSLGGCLEVYVQAGRQAGREIAGVMATSHTPSPSRRGWTSKCVCVCIVCSEITGLHTRLDSDLVFCYEESQPTRIAMTTKHRHGNWGWGLCMVTGEKFHLVEG